MLWQPSNKLLRYFLRRFVSHSLWGCCQFGDCSMKSLPFDISPSLGLLFTFHLLITSWSVLQKLRQGCFDNHQINCWDTFCGDSWAIRSEAVANLEIVAWNPYRLIFLCHWVFFSHVICWLHPGLFCRNCAKDALTTIKQTAEILFAEIREPFALRLLSVWRLYNFLFSVEWFLKISSPPHMFHFSRHLETYLRIQREKGIHCTPWLTLSEESEVCLAPRVSSKISARKKVRHHRTMKVMRSGTRLGIGGWFGLVGLLSFGGLKWHNPLMEDYWTWMELGLAPVLPSLWEFGERGVSFHEGFLVGAMFVSGSGIYTKQSYFIYIHTHVCGLVLL